MLRERAPASRGPSARRAWSNAASPHRRSARTPMVEWPDTTITLDESAAMRDRNARQRRRGERRRDAGDDLERHAGRRQRDRFFAAAAEHERIAALQPDHALAAPRAAHEAAVDRFLADRRPARALADRQALRARARAAARPARPARRRARGRPRPAGARHVASTDPDRQGQRPRARRTLSSDAPGSPVSLSCGTPIMRALPFQRRASVSRAACRAPRRA